MGCSNPYLFTIIVNGPVKDNDVIDLNPQSLASISKLHSTTKYLPQTRPSPRETGLSECGKSIPIASTFMLT